jgi:flagellar assembly factor FliW
MTSAALAYDMPSSMTVASDLLGPLTVDANAVIQFSKGLLGFPECRSFVLLPSEREHLYWLQSVDYAALAFLMIDPFVFFEGYTIDLTSTELGRVALSPDQVTVLSMVTLPRQREGRPTANLQGPIVINHGSGDASQVVLSDGKYGIREAFDL